MCLIFYVWRRQLEEWGKYYTLLCLSSRVFSRKYVRDMRHESRSVRWNVWVVGMEGKPLHWMAHVLEEWKKNGATLRWQQSRIPDMRTYTEKQEDELSFSAKVLSQATEECISIFKGCTGYDAILSNKEEIKNG